jgi:hypothetical protein
MSVPGFNPIMWDCLDRGCFNRHRHFNIEEFSECFPSKIGFTDIDAFVELNGHFLIADFKLAAGDIGGGADLTVGQRRAFEALTRLSDRITVMVARCNYITSEITEFYMIYKGRARDWILIDLNGLKARVNDWARHADPKRMGAA